MPPLLDLILSHIRRHGPMTVADYMELALYEPELGYYSSAATRSGREGDFFTNVDVGPLFGEMIAHQLDEIWLTLEDAGATRFDLVDAGAGDGRLARDILDAACRSFHDLYDVLHVTLVDRSPAAATAQRSNVGPHLTRVTTGACRLPSGITGAIIANELLDALPVHRVVNRNGTLFEVHVGESNGKLLEVELPPSTDRIARYLERLDVALPEGLFAEIGLAAADWIAEAARTLDRGFLVLFDYAHEAGELYSSVHASGTMTSYHRHLADQHHWLALPGSSDITSHVNLTSIRAAAIEAGLTPLGAIDQTYFLLGVAARLDDGQSVESIRRRLAARTLLMPGGLGSTIKVMAFGKNVGAPVLPVFESGRLT